MSFQMGRVHNSAASGWYPGGVGVEHLVVIIMRTLLPVCIHCYLILCVTVSTSSAPLAPHIVLGNHCHLSTVMVSGITQHEGT